MKESNSMSETQLAAFLQRHVGHEKRVPARHMAKALHCREGVVRMLVDALRQAGIAVCGHHKTGYFIAATVAELEEQCAFQRARALGSILVESRLRHTPTHMVAKAVVAQLQALESARRVAAA